MPRGDRTGPMGQGPMTGRGMGYCSGFNMPGFMNFGFGRGFGRGRGFAWRERFIPVQPVVQQELAPMQQIQPRVITEKEEKQFLEQELGDLKQEMKEIEKRLKELKS